MSYILADNDYGKMHEGDSYNITVHGVSTRLNGKLPDGEISVTIGIQQGCTMVPTLRVFNLNCNRTNLCSEDGAVLH